MAPTIDVDVSHHAVAAVAGESVLTVTLFGRRLVPLHCQVVVGHPQLSVSRLWVQPERLTFEKSVLFSGTQQNTDAWQSRVVWHHVLLVLSFAVSLLRFPAWFMAFTMKMYLVPH